MTPLPELIQQMKTSSKVLFLKILFQILKLPDTLYMPESMPSTKNTTMKGSRHESCSQGVCRLLERTLKKKFQKVNYKFSKYYESKIQHTIMRNTRPSLEAGRLWGRDTGVVIWRICRWQSIHGDPLGGRIERSKRRPPSELEHKKWRGRGSRPHCIKSQGNLLYSMASILSPMLKTAFLSVSTSPKLLTAS